MQITYGYFMIGFFMKAKQAKSGPHLEMNRL